MGFSSIVVITAALIIVLETVDGLAGGVATAVLVLLALVVDMVGLAPTLMSISTSFELLTAILGGILGFQVGAWIRKRLKRDGTPLLIHYYNE